MFDERDALGDTPFEQMFERKSPFSTTVDLTSSGEWKRRSDERRQ